METFTKNFSKIGTGAVQEICTQIETALKSNAKLKESFAEDWNMSNGSYFTTTKIAQKIWSKQYDEFSKYYDATVMYTPADLGMPEGAGAYKVPKIENTVAGRLAPGEDITYANAGANEITVETETYGVGLRINRRALKRYATGVISRLLTSASNGVHTAIATFLSNGFVTGANSGNTVTGGISVDKIADAKLKIQNAVDSNSIKFGFKPDTLILTATGKNVLIKSSDYKLITQRWGNSQGDYKESPLVYDGMKVVEWELVTALKGAAVVHGLVLAKEYYLIMVFETGMDMFEGRIPGTPGDQEFIFAIDAGFAVASDVACSVITA